MTQRQSSAEGNMPHTYGTKAHGRPIYLYPSIPAPQQPPAAYMSHAKRFPAGHTIEGTRVQGSISSASGSSGISYQKPRPSPPDSQWPSPLPDRTLVNSNRYQKSQSTQRQPTDSDIKGYNHKRSEFTEHSSPTLAYVRGRQQIAEEIEEEDEEDHAIWVLFWLACLDPFHSLAGCLFTIFAIFILLLASPIRLLNKRCSLGDQVIRTLAPLFKHHLDTMHASSAEFAFEWDFRPGMLVLVLVIAPLISLGVAVASWITAAFWVFTSIMGNPDGTERRDDGRDAVLAVRNWWESCLLKAVKPKPQPKQSMRSVV